MNAPVKPAPPYTAQQLADMPHGEGRRALAAQECAHMQDHHGRRLLKEVQERFNGRMEVARLTCIGIEERRFLWEAFQDCWLCSGLGLIAGVNGRTIDCNECKDDATEYLFTDYDGNLIEERPA